MEGGTFRFSHNSSVSREAQLRLVGLTSCYDFGSVLPVAEEEIRLANVAWRVGHSRVFDFGGSISGCFFLFWDQYGRNCHSTIRSRTSLFPLFTGQVPFINIIPTYFSHSEFSIFLEKPILAIGLDNFHRRCKSDVFPGRTGKQFLLRQLPMERTNRLILAFCSLTSIFPSEGIYNREVRLQERPSNYLDLPSRHCIWNPILRPLHDLPTLWIIFCFSWHASPIPVLAYDVRICEDPI